MTEESETPDEAGTPTERVPAPEPERSEVPRAAAPAAVAQPARFGQLSSGTRMAIVGGIVGAAAVSFLLGRTIDQHRPELGEGPWGHGGMEQGEGPWTQQMPAGPMPGGPMPGGEVPGGFLPPQDGTLPQAPGGSQMPIYPGVPVPGQGQDSGNGAGGA